ncbi:hypothetical protein K151_1980 [Proteus hauseri ZMd44]|nr:hypothetical protein K151_1980 [Proteus hauseri ZMd44]
MSLSQFYKERVIYLIDNYKVFFISVIVATISAILITYVNRGIGRGINSDDYDKRDILKIIKTEIASIKMELNEKISNLAQNTESIDLTNDEKEKLISQAKKRIINNTIKAANISLREDVKNYKDRISLFRYQENITRRLQGEIDRLNRRGGVNLVVGVAIAIVGIVYLGYVVTEPVVITDKILYLFHIIPRVLFVILIEIFAYFFLRLYKNGFEEVKYFQNELTNIDSKFLGIRILNDIKNEELKIDILNELIKTERNFILEKGQSTVSLERDRIEMNEEKNILLILKDILKSKQ